MSLPLAETFPRQTLFTKVMGDPRMTYDSIDGTSIEIGRASTFLAATIFAELLMLSDHKLA